MSENYKFLKKGELVEPGDEVDICADGWRDPAKWVLATEIGQPAPDPAYPSHRKYRRKLPTTPHIKSHKEH